MTLPIGQLARSTFAFGDIPVAIRSLSRKETLVLRGFGDDIDGAEAYILQCGTDSTAEEVEQFRTTWSALRVDDLVTAIAQLSGFLAEGDKSNGDSPKG